MIDFKRLVLSNGRKVLITTVVNVSIDDCSGRWPAVQELNIRKESKMDQVAFAEVDYTGAVNLDCQIRFDIPPGKAATGKSVSSCLADEIDLVHGATDQEGDDK